MYIYHLLENFRDMSNRKEIVLRIILHSKVESRLNRNHTESTCPPPKRGHLQSVNNENNQPAIKIRKLEDLIGSTVKEPKLKKAYSTVLSPVPRDLQLNQLSGISDFPSASDVNATPFGQLPKNDFPATSVVNSTQVREVTPAATITSQDLKSEQTYVKSDRSLTCQESCTRPVSQANAPVFSGGIYENPATSAHNGQSRVDLLRLVTSTTTSSSDGQAVQFELPSSNLESKRRFSASYGYEIVGTSEHFDYPTVNLSTKQNTTDLPTFNGQLSVGRNCTVGFSEQLVDSDSVKSELPDDIAQIAVDLSSKYESVSRPVDFSDVELFNNIDIQSESSSNSVIQVPDANVKIEHPLDDIPVQSKERESQDSNATEVYSPHIVPDEAIPVAQHYTVKVTSPTSLKIQKTVKQEPNFDHAEEQNQQASTTTLIADVTPSTSKQDHTDMDAAETPFDLLEYVRDITGAPLHVIKNHCSRLHLPRNAKPTPDLLSILLDRILTNSVDSESSDVEEVNESDNESFADQGSSVDNNEQIQKTLNTAYIKQENSNMDSKDTKPKDLDMQLVNHLCSIFPDACPKYIRGLCHNKKMSNEVLDDIITIILDENNEYPKRPKPPPEPELIPENQFQILSEVLPDADPDYLRMMCDQCEGRSDMLKTFLNNAMEQKNYPTLKEYQRRQQLSAQQKQYTTDFDVENFLKVIPEPHTFFSDPSRKLNLSATDAHYALVFLRNKYNKLPIKSIQAIFTKSNSNIGKCIKELNKAMANTSLHLKCVRKPMNLPGNITNIPLLQELAFYMHEEDITAHFNQLKEKEESERLKAKNQGLLKTCSCCFDDEVLPKDIYCCQNGCQFCKSCIIKSSEVHFGEGKLDFPCLMDCSSSFSLQTLQAVLSPKLFSKVAQKKALDEVKAAGIEDLETCPFCDFATIPAEGYNIFTCMNPECMKESCRMCKEPSHIPLRCDEIEKDEDVRARTYVENKMTEALLRKCYKCGVKFFKEEGCNKMTCSCGAQMCYVCGQPVTSYKHFNGNGGDRYDLCPLYSDTSVLNKENVLKGAEEAKAAIGNVALKHDPTADVNQHYEERKKKYPQAHLLVGQQLQVAPVPPERRPVYRRRQHVHHHHQNQARNIDDAMDALMMRLFDAFEH